MNFNPQIKNSFYLENAVPQKSRTGNEFKINKFFNPFKNNVQLESQADGKSSINSHKLNIFESKDAPRSSRQDPENPFQPSFMQESFNLTDNIFDDRGSMDKISLNLFKDTMRQFSNSFVLNSFNQNFKPVLADPRQASRNQFGLVQSRSLHKIEKISPVKIPQMPPIQSNLPLMAEPKEPVKFFDLPRPIERIEKRKISNLGKLWMATIISEN